MELSLRVSYPEEIQGGEQFSRKGTHWSAITKSLETEYFPTRRGLNNLHISMHWFIMQSLK